MVLSFRTLNSKIQSYLILNDISKLLSDTFNFISRCKFSVTYVCFTGALSRIIKLCEEKREAGEIKKGRKGSCVPSVKGITNLGNTCFFNAVIQVSHQNDLYTVNNYSN